MSAILLNSIKAIVYSLVQLVKFDNVLALLLSNSINETIKNYFGSIYFALKQPTSVLLHLAEDNWLKKLILSKISALRLLKKIVRVYYYDSVFATFPYLLCTQYTKI